MRCITNYHKSLDPPHLKVLQPATIESLLPEATLKPWLFSFLELPHLWTTRFLPPKA